MNMNMKFTFIEVCCGAGGLSTGFMKAGFVPIILNDINRDCCNTICNHHLDTTNVEYFTKMIRYKRIRISNKQRLSHMDDEFECIIVNDDMTSLIQTYLPMLSNIAGESMDMHLTDILIGGMPCQSFSQAGLRKGLDDDRGQLLLEFANLIEVVNPKMFLVENVKGLTTHNNGKTFRTVLDSLSLEGKYSIEYRVLNAAFFEVPQKRERIFIVGIHKDLKEKISSSLGEMAAFLFPNSYTNEAMTCRDALMSPIKMEEKRGVEYSEYKKSFFAYIPQGGCWIHLPDELQKKYMGASYFATGGRRGILHRLSLDKPCVTLLCNPQSKQSERCHPLEDRPLNIREYARIQTFPDDYYFYGSIQSQYKQIGNAVPIKLAYHIAYALRSFLLSFEC